MLKTWKRGCAGAWLAALAGACGAADEWPKSVHAVCGEVGIRIDGPKLWTPSRIEYKGVRLATEQSAYGTVASFPGIGIVGSAHLDKGREEVFSLRFTVDGRESARPPERLACESFRVDRRSRIGPLEVEGVVEVKDGRLYETAALRAGRDVAVDFVYNFMHAWEPAASAYLAAAPDGKELEGELSDAPEFNRFFYIDREVTWVAVYQASRRMGAVSRLLERPAAGGATAMLWNAPPVYRKFYLKSFVNGRVPAGFHGVYRMTTGFFEASGAEWKEAARRVAASLQ